ncbi:MAG TPA: alpha/beta hydrolase-fold protein [Solirubrobacteraceae bacterium]|nr:alpha/beta hydrolase-fold protein [Solirubrobacteraceae bacterium]
MGRPLSVLAGVIGLGVMALTAPAAVARPIHTRPMHTRPMHAFSPEVIHTGTPPTGYEVTFRYYDPGATTVQIRGEWFFSNAANTSTSTSQGLLPSEWSPGDFPIANPNDGPAANWPVAQMSLDRSTGVWSYTTPLPSGTYTYGFYVNCTSAPPALTGCIELSDPSNPPWNHSGSVEPDSEVYVPSDPRFGTPDMSWEAPNPRVHGTLLDVSYPDPQSTLPVGSHPLAIYLPPGYDPHRRVPYPTLYLSHGGGGNEVDWTTQGVANRIIDNLIAARLVQPMVIVMTDFNNLGSCNLFPPTEDASCYAQDVSNYVIPYVNAHYNVSPDANDRAFAGLSLGGLAANYLLFNDTTLFGYFGSWSIANLGAPPTTSALWQNPALKTRLGIELGGGNFDFLTIPGLDSYEASFMSFGIPFTDARLDAGHEWYTWRQLLYDYATTVAFRTTTTAVRVGSRGWHSHGHGLIATVSGDTTEIAPPAGSVQFYVDGQKAGRPRPLEHGVAFLPAVRGGSSASATYGGDNYYNGSTSPTVSVP